jgi:hypothetical protein
MLNVIRLNDLMIVMMIDGMLSVFIQGVLC